MLDWWVNHRTELKLTNRLEKEDKKRRTLLDSAWIFDLKWLKWILSLHWLGRSGDASWEFNPNHTPSSSRILVSKIEANNKKDHMLAKLQICIRKSIQIFKFPDWGSFKPNPRNENENYRTIANLQVIAWGISYIIKALSSKPLFFHH